MNLNDIARELNEGSEYSRLFREIKKTFKIYPAGGTRGFQVGKAIQDALRDLSNEGFLEQGDFDELISFLEDIKKHESEY